jgi:hypothetical protein
MGITEMHIGFLVGKSERKGPLGKRRCLWEAIKTNLKEIGWKGLDWNGIAQNRNRCRVAVNTVMILGSIKCGEFLY